MEDNYYTLNGYSRREAAVITAAMEDYLEMLCRLEEGGQSLRIGQIAAHLHVRPPSASRMIKQLRELGLVNFEKYGIVSLTEEGREMGKYLLFRHRVLLAFFCRINHSEDELTQVEKVEHFIDRRTLMNLAAFIGITE